MKNLNLKLALVLSIVFLFLPQVNAEINTEQAVENFKQRASSAKEYVGNKYSDIKNKSNIKLKLTRISIRKLKIFFDRFLPEIRIQNYFHGKNCADSFPEVHADDFENQEIIRPQSCSRYHQNIHEE